VKLTPTVDPVMSIKRTSEIRDLVLMGLNHPMATAIPLNVTNTIILTLVLATNTRSTSVARAIALQSDHEAIFATTHFAQITHIRSMDPATTTKRTWEIQARVLVVLCHSLATVILLTVFITITLVLATNTESTSVDRAVALVLGHLQTIVITLLVPVTFTTGHAMETNDLSAITAVAEEYDHLPAIAITPSTTETLSPMSVAAFNLS